MDGTILLNLLLDPHLASPRVTVCGRQSLLKKYSVTLVHNGKTKLTQGPLQWDVTVGKRDGALQTTWVSGNL